MDDAWIGVIGGAVGAVGTLAGSTLAQWLGVRAAARLRSDQRSEDVADRWYEHSRDLYLRVLTLAHDAELAADRIAQPTQIDEVSLAFLINDLVDVYRALINCETELLLLASDDMFMAGKALVDSIVDDRLLSLDAIDRRAGFNSLRRKYVSVIDAARADLNIPLPAGRPSVLKG